MFCVAVWKFLSLHEAVAWNIFLRIFAVFCWISWNFIAVFILVTSLHFFVDMFCVAVWKFLSLHEAVAWNIFLRIFAVFCWISWNCFTFFIYKRSNWCYCWCVCCRSFCSVHIFTNNCNRWSCSCKFRFWFEGYCSVWCYCVSTNTWNSLSC